MTGEREARLAEVMRGHMWHHTRETHCSCGFRAPLAQLAVEGYLAHVAQAIAANERDVAAEAWDEGWEAAAAAIDQPGYGTAALRLRHLARTGFARADRLTVTGDQGTSERDAT